ncbi:MAG: 50S ribosomal protein L17 [Bacteroidales bacterium]|nr:50S ribosomal protein L17 [Bacteroidales bacterium]
MRHLRKFNHLGRTSSHRKAMLANMATSLIIHKRITTTLAKAKALRTYIEPLITRSKEDSTHSRRMVFKYLQSKTAVSELFREIAQKVTDRPGGYTRILKTGTRLGDNAEMCMIELVDYNENLLVEKEERKAKTTRRRRGSGKKKQEETSGAEVLEAVEVVEEEAVAEVVADKKEEVKEEAVAEVVAEKKEEVKEEAVAGAVAEKKEEEKKEEPKAEEKKEEDKETKE